MTPVVFDLFHENRKSDEAAEPADSSTKCPPPPFPCVGPPPLIWEVVPLICPRLEATVVLQYQCFIHHTTVNYSISLWPVHLRAGPWYVLCCPPAEYRRLSGLFTLPIYFLVEPMHMIGRKRTAIKVQNRNARLPPRKSTSPVSHRGS